ncbi:peptidoglycan DD-metalloendopeptidase family protein [Anabaena sp. CA = ATCC 33047]|uniref:peptidoglycan DD-metalloendopeptidase family protein n=1 Tax=Anabaena sp. (strain CA / ATCC 33047) TaxID=52271 RepID=UPI001E33D16D|nr:peptidoglycan DD-metalloendopeptidase family protein [Anabaena sp. CA = ATCC 33047]
MLKNTPSSDDAPADQLNISNSKMIRRAQTQAAMIGLAISMGATGLLVTRQGDQAQAAAPVGSQKAASTISADSDQEVKFAASKLGNPIVISASVPDNQVIVEPTAISQVPGLEAKWQVLASGMSVQAATAENFSPNTAKQEPSPSAQTETTAAKESGEPLANANSVIVDQTKTIKTEPQTEVANSTSASGEMNAKLKAQQEFALNRLQEKSNRLRKSLAELRSEESKDLSKTTTQLTQPTTVANQMPPLSTSGTVIEQSANVTAGSPNNLVSSLKQPQAINIPVQPAATTAPVTSTIPASSQQKTYNVKPGDTLAAIAKRHNISISELIQANSLSNPNQLQISQKIVIPAAPVNRGITIETPVVVNSPSLEYGNNPDRATFPVSIAGVNRNSTTGETSVIADNSRIIVPTPATNNSPTQADDDLVAPETAADNADNDNIDAQGMGGETPVPSDVVATQQRKQPANQTATAKSDPRLQSLQAEIQRLQQKYRAQKSGNTAIPEATTESENAAVAIPVATPNSVTASQPRANRKNLAIPIAVPSPLTPSYANQPEPVKPEFRAIRPLNNEPINPEFLSNNGASQLNSSRNTPSQRLATPPTGINANDSLGRMRGTTVSPTKLPPLAAVDQYLPQPIDQATPPPSNSSVAYIWPAKGVLTSGYGWRWGRMHRGIDIANAVGTPIYASADGVVEKAGWNRGGYGILVDIRHPDGSLTRYAHNSRVLVRIGQQVRQGQQIADMGNTGFSTGPHSHFEIHPSGKGAVNPIAMLPSRGRV